jgi:serine/threonine-protein kinase
MTPVQEGQVLAGKYRIERILGVGGMGVVVSALHLQLDERVALKFLLPEALTNPEAVARFAREARAAVKIKSVHVARVSDVGTLETGAPYMVMEFLQGQDLSAVIRDRGALPYADAVDLVLQACEALSEAHALGIVHRDLKPANLFLITAADGSPCIKVLDFGISKIISADSSGHDYGMTKTHAIIGSPLYMSPEQMQSSRDVDGRSDIWAVGIILFELLAARPPFLADTMPQLCAAILQGAAPSPRQYRPDLPPGLEAAILRCLEKDRTLRFANVGELAAALAPFGTSNARRSAERVSKVLSAAGISSSGLSLTPPVQPDVATQSAWGKSTHARSPGALWILLALLLALGAGAGALLLHRSATAPAPETNSTSPTPQVGAGAKAPSEASPLVTPVVTAAAPPVTNPTAASAAPTEIPAARATSTPPAQKLPATAKPRGASHSSVPKSAPTAPVPQPLLPAPKPTVDPLDGRR